MEIIEQSIVAKNPDKRSEDGIVTTSDFIAVIDGSTSKSDRRPYRSLSLRQRTNGEQAMLLVSRYIRQMNKAVTCHQFCTGVTHFVARHYIKSLLPRLAAHPEERLTASAIVFSRLRREIWLVGDCQCLVGGELIDNPKPCERELAERRAAIIRQAPEPWDHFLDDDTARAAIIPRMLETMKQQNTGYAVIDGFPIPEQHVRMVTLDFQPWEIVLASDGYPFLCATLAESEEQLARQRATDPLNIGTFKATKAFARGNNSFDDRAYIRFRA